MMVITRTITLRGDIQPEVPFQDAPDGVILFRERLFFKGDGFIFDLETGKVTDLIDPDTDLVNPVKI